MKTKRFVPWVALALAATALAVVVLWFGLGKERERADVPPVFQRRNIDALDLDGLKAYITACESAGDFEECERAYQRAIRLTQGDDSKFRDMIDFKFGLAGLYLNSLWEYGQFGGEEKTPPALGQAIHIYDELIASYPGSGIAAEAQFRKGEVFHNEFSGYWNSLHREDAIREFRKVVEQYPGTDQARRAQEKLALLAREE